MAERRVKVKPAYQQRMRDRRRRIFMELHREIERSIRLPALRELREAG